MRTAIRRLAQAHHRLRPGNLPHRLFASLTWGLVVSTCSCVTYEHQVDIQVRDPRQTWLERVEGGERLEPARVDTPVVVPGTTSDTVERAASGAIEINGRTIVGRSGTMEATPFDLGHIHGGPVLRIPICRHGRGAGCRDDMQLATPMLNVTLLRERDVPVWFVGVIELLVAGGLTFASDLAWSPQNSGGPLLLAAGIGTGILGIVQLLAPAKNENTIVP